MKIKIVNLMETKKDANVLRKANLNYVKNLKRKEKKDGQDLYVYNKRPEEEDRDFYARLNKIADEEKPIYGSELIDWIGNLEDEYFPTNNRYKEYLPWLVDQVFTIEVGDYRGTQEGWEGTNFRDLSTYNNDIKLLVDFLNTKFPQGIPRDTWGVDLPNLVNVARLAKGDTPGSEYIGDYQTKKVVARLENGFTIVEVPPEDLGQEGEVMQHCIGDGHYCDQIAKGAQIYSLRDKLNKAHATIEVGVDYDADVPRHHRLPQTVKQIKGKQNSAPKEEYRPYIINWLATTNFIYKTHYEYLAILSVKEIEKMIESNVMTPAQVLDLAGETRDPKLVEYFVGKLADPRPIFTYGSGLIGSLSRNGAITMEQALIIFKTNLQKHVLGDLVSRLFKTGNSQWGEKTYDNQDFIARAWPIIKERGRLDKETNKVHIDEELMYSLSVLTEFSENRTVNEEIASALLNPVVIAKLIDKKILDRSNMHSLFTKTLQNYLGGGVGGLSHDRDILYKIHKLSKTPEGEDLAPDFKIQSYIAKSASIPDDLAKDISQNPVGILTTKNLLLNPSVKESLKYGALKKMLRRITGISESSSLIKQLGRAIWEERGQFSEKFLLWALDATVFDGVLVGEAERAFLKKHKFYPKKGIDKQWNEMVQEEREKMKQEIKRPERSGADFTRPPWEDSERWIDVDDPIQEEVNNYFNFFKKNSKSLMEEITQYFGETPVEEIDDQGDGMDSKDLEYKQFFDEQNDEFFKNPDHEVPWETES